MKHTSQVLMWVCLGIFNGSQAIQIDQHLSNNNYIDQAASNHLLVAQ